MPPETQLGCRSHLFRLSLPHLETNNTGKNRLFFKKSCLTYIVFCKAKLFRLCWLISLIFMEDLLEHKTSVLSMCKPNTRFIPELKPAVGPSCLQPNDIVRKADSGHNQNHIGFSYRIISIICNLVTSRVLLEFYKPKKKEQRSKHEQ